MKNQYFGDFYDYIKYGLIRLLTARGGSTTSVCWLLTQNDGTPDGHRVKYLRDPNAWRHLDSDLFEALARWVVRLDARDVKRIEESGLLPRCRFFSMNVADGATERRQYFESFLRFAQNSTLMFFDPDNGLEVKSVPFGRKRSSKYLYWSEVNSAFAAGHSILVYQHLPPVPRDLIVNRVVAGFGAATTATTVYSYAAKRVAFFLAPQQSHVNLFAKANREIGSAWGELLEVQQRTS